MRLCHDSWANLFFASASPAFLTPIEISRTNHPETPPLQHSNNRYNMSKYTINRSSNCFNTTNSYTTNVLNNNYTIADDRSELLTWLSPLDPGLRHCDIQERRVNDVGEWLMGTEEFRRWCGLGGGGGRDKAVLFCYGNPGVGKTFIR